MLDLTLEEFNSPKNVSKYVQLASIALGIHVQSLSYHDVRRLITVQEGEDEDDDTPNIVDDTAVAVDGDGQYRAERQTERSFYDSEVIRQVPNDRYTSKRSWF